MAECIVSKLWYVTHASCFSKSKYLTKYEKCPNGRLDSHIHAISVFRAGLFKTYSMDLCIACAYCDTVVSANKIID